MYVRMFVRLCVLMPEIGNKENIFVYTCMNVCTRA